MLFFALIGQKHENISVCSNKMQSAQPGNMEIVMYAEMLSQEMIQVNFPEICKWSVEKWPLAF